MSRSIAVAQTIKGGALPLRLTEEVGELSTGPSLALPATLTILVVVLTLIFYLSVSRTM